MEEKAKKDRLKGIIIFVIIALVIAGFTIFTRFKKEESMVKTTLYGAVGGGKENFLADAEFIKIMSDEYGIEVTNDNWSNGKLVKNDVVREDGSKYDFIFFSDQRFYDYYKLDANTEKGEAKRYYVQDGSLTLNTPIVIYSWKQVVDSLIKEEIVTFKDNVYYITDMKKLMNYILEKKKWSEIGLDSIYGNININSTDPVTSSPGATYYGLLLSILCDGDVNEQNIDEALEKLKVFYTKSGYMNNTPADLFESYLKTGMGGKPMIVDYEKSLIDFAKKNPNGYNQIKDQIVVLYPTPTIWNSHCIAALSDNGKTYLKVFENAKVQQIAWERYGFRTGVTGGNYDVTKAGVNNIPQVITSTVPSLKMDTYNKLIEYLGNNE